MFIIDRDRRDDDVRGCGTRYTRRVSRGELDRRRTDGVGTTGAQRPLTVHGHNRRTSFRRNKGAYSISLILPNTFFVFVFVFFCLSFNFVIAAHDNAVVVSCCTVTDHLNETFAGTRKKNILISNMFLTPCVRHASPSFVIRGRLAFRFCIQSDNIQKINNNII